MRFRMPSVRDVRLPSGAVPANWPLLLAIGLSVMLLVGLVLTGEDPIMEPDPLDLPPREVEEVQVRDPRRVEAMGDVESLVRDLQQREQRAVTREEAEDTAQRRAAQAEQRARAARLARARRYVQELRERRAQPESTSAVEPIDRVARTSGEADLLETLRLEDITRQVEAFRAPFVVSSARGIGERQHEVLPPAFVPPFRASAPAFPPPPAVAPAAEAVPPVPAGLAAAPAAPQASVFDDPAAVVGVGAGPSSRFVSGSPVAAGGGSAFDLGPPADAGLGDLPSGVVVTPTDFGGDRLFEGTMLPAVLQTQLDGQFSGPLSAQITRPVYSADRQRVLVPRGTIALGSSSGVQDLWQGRLAIGFHRLIFPDGRWVTMEFAGMSGLGETSLADQVDRHYLQLFGVAGAIGALAGFSQSGSQSGGFRSAASEQMASTSLQVVSQFLNRLPDVTIRAGHRVNIRLMQDLIIPRQPAARVVP